MSPDGRFEYVLQEDGTAIIRDWIKNSRFIDVPALVDWHPVTVSSSAFFETDATIMGPDVGIVIYLKKNLPLF